MLQRARRAGATSWAISSLRSEIACGLVYSIPGWMALAVLLLDRRRPPRPAAAHRIVPALLAGALGLALQAQPYPACVLAGRVIYGWALFRTTVRMELRLFELSSPERYATDFSVIHVAQNLGALVVEQFELRSGADADRDRVSPGVRHRRGDSLPLRPRLHPAESPGMSKALDCPGGAR